MLSKLANSRFGSTVQVGSVAAPFVACDSLPVEGDAARFEVVRDAPEGNAVVKECRVRRGRDPDVLQVLFAFAIDATAVAQRVGLG